MKLFTIFVIFLYLSICNGETFEGISKNVNNYGPFEVKFDYFKACHGPKLKDATIVGAELGNVTEAPTIYVNITSLEDLRLQKIKISVYNFVQKTKKILWSYKIDQPCQHYAISTMLAKYLSVNKKTCTVTKGFYSVAVNMKEITKNYFGQNFFYGETLFEAVVLSKNANIFCFISKQKFVKKEGKKDT